MARYIDVEPLEDKLKEHIKKTESELMLGALSTFKRLLDITPTADVAPIKHGRWINCELVESGFKFVRCSECKHGDMNSRMYKFCPNCGAKMDGDGNEID